MILALYFSSKYCVTITWAPFEIGRVLLLARRSRRRRLANGIACDFGRMIRMAADETRIELIWLRGGASAGGSSSLMDWSILTGITDPDPVPISVNAIVAQPVNWNHTPQILRFNQKIWNSQKKINPKQTHFEIVWRTDVHTEIRTISENSPK